MTLLLVMVFIIPVLCFVVNSIVDGSGPLIKAIPVVTLTLPDLAWLNTIPVIGAKSYMQAGTICWIWGGRRSWRKSVLILAPPPPGSLGRAAHIGRFMVH